ncbi:hypothetical protein [Tistrella sp.]|jgi:hypothetical protein|uniref:hypothetical protein n=1 Tax=Tistrella sp. TaxID=2024861 RepID=UPI0025DCEBB1|nr:hypothetical protein [Tistrella sp.]|tara:strand:- start:1694 stop:1849 length:156 start_codon:yes stop_codon:yes gene_type:complete
MSPQLDQGTDRRHHDDDLALRPAWRQPVLSIEALSCTADSSSGAIDGYGLS